MVNRGFVFGLQSPQHDPAMLRRSNLRKELVGPFIQHIGQLQHILEIIAIDSEDNVSEWYGSYWIEAVESLREAFAYAIYLRGQAEAPEEDDHGWIGPVIIQLAPLLEIYSDC